MIAIADVTASITNIIANVDATPNAAVCQEKNRNVGLQKYIDLTTISLITVFLI